MIYVHCSGTGTGHCQNILSTRIIHDSNNGSISMRTHHKLSTAKEKYLLYYFITYSYIYTYTNTCQLPFNAI